MTTDVVPGQGIPHSFPAETISEPGKHKARPHALLCRWLLWLAIGTYILAVGRLVLHRHERLGSGVFDLGIFDQAIWLISRGYAPFLSTRGMHALGDHFSPILYLLAPLYWVCDSPKTLLITQTAALAIGAWPVFLIAEKRLGSPWLGLVFAVNYLMYPALQWMNIFDFHPESFATLSLLFALWFVQSGRIRAFFAAVAFTLLCKETMGLTVAVLGIYAAYYLGRRAGVATVLCGLLSTVLALAIMRMFTHDQPSAYISLYSQYGDNFRQVFSYCLTHPIEIMAVFTSADSAQYLGDLLSPLAFLVFLAPELAFMAVLPFAANMLSNRGNMHTVYFQYNATIIPFLYLAAIEGVAVCSALVNRVRPGRAPALRFALAVLLVIGALYGRENSPFAEHRQYPTGRELDVAMAQNVQQAIAQIPPDASVSTQSCIATHIAHRRALYMFPNPFQETCWGNSAKALVQETGYQNDPIPVEQFARSIAMHHVDYVLLCPELTCWPLDDSEYFPCARGMLMDPHYGVIWTQGGMILLARNADRQSGLQRLQHSVDGLKALKKIHYDPTVKQRLSHRQYDSSTASGIQHERSVE